MKKVTVGLLAAAAGLGAAWYFWPRSAVAAPAENARCYPTPLQLDAFGKLQGIAITINGSGDKLGAHLEGAPQFTFVSRRGTLQQTGGARIVSDADATKALCAYIRSPAGSAFNAAAIARYIPPGPPLAAPKQAP
jgi:hypothetical protein